MVLLGFGVAFIVFLVFILLNALLGGATHGGGNVSIVVASHEIAFRNAISPEDLTLKSVASDDVPPGAFKDTAQFKKSNYVAEVNIPSGSPLTANVVVSDASSITGVQSAFLPIPQGYVGLTIRTSELQGVGGYIQVGDYIAVTASANVSVFQVQGNGAQTKEAPVVKGIFTNLHVIKVGPATAPAQGASGSVTSGGATGGVSSSLTVVMTRCDADFLTWFQNNTTVSYYLQSYKDYASEPATANANCPVTTENGVGPQQVDAVYHFTQVVA